MFSVMTPHYSPNVIWWSVFPLFCHSERAFGRGRISLS